MGKTFAVPVVVITKHLLVAMVYSETPQNYMQKFGGRIKKTDVLVFDATNDQITMCNEMLARHHDEVHALDKQHRMERAAMRAQLAPSA